MDATLSSCPLSFQMPPADGVRFNHNRRLHGRISADRYFGFSEGVALRLRPVVVEYCYDHYLLLTLQLHRIKV